MSKPFTIALLLALFVSGCNKTDDPQISQPSINQPPAAFSVLAKQIAGTTDVMLTWNKAKDPDGDPVTYAVVMKDTLAKNLADTTYTLKNIGYSTILSGTVVATDSKKANTTATFSFTTSENPYTNIPDANFEKALIDLKIDDTQDGKVLTANVQKVAQLEVELRKISSLRGIEAFSSLTRLTCGGNSLASLDISKNTLLTYLDCSATGLTSLDVSNNTKLTALDCSFNKLTTLDVSKNTVLATLQCGSNSLASLDVSKNIALTTLGCGNDTGVSPGNHITSLDLSKNPALTFLRCHSNQLASLDLRNNTKLSQVWCFDNKIQTVCVSSLSAVTTDWIKDKSTVYQVCP